MGLLDKALDAAKSALSGTQTSALGQSLIDLLESPQIGGIQGLAQHFQDKGLGGEVSSWIGTGPNQAISPDQLANVLGPERITQLASTVGIPPERIQQAMAQLLPNLVDHLTPNGQIPETGDLAQAGRSVLRTLLG